jgi:rhamnulokinase
VAGDRVVLEEVCRFPNRPVRLADGLHWDTLHLFAEALDGLKAAGPLVGIGVDSWGVDYGLLDADGRLLGLPFHYRDTRTEGMIERAFQRVGADELYAATGIQTMPINTVFQLLAEQGSAALAAAEHILLMADLFAFWLSGELVCERTLASTSGLLQVQSGEWALDVIARLGLPDRPFGAVVDPGARLGPALPFHGLDGTEVFAVGGHDTASAFAATPVQSESAAILSSGTWSLLGVELAEPVISDAARAANLTNERGIGGTVRLLSNVMGLWLEQECLRAWGLSRVELDINDRALATVPLFDPDEESLLRPGVMPAKVAAACARSGQPTPADQNDTMLSIYVSLACKYRVVLERLQNAIGRELTTIHVVGGGGRNTRLCQLTADIAGREVIAGPVEATGLGNVLVQLWAAGEVASRDEVRALARRSAETITYEPTTDRALAEATFERFNDLIRAAAAAPSVA